MILEVVECRAGVVRVRSKVLARSLCEVSGAAEEQYKGGAVVATMAKTVVKSEEVVSLSLWITHKRVYPVTVTKYKAREYTWRVC